MSTLEEYLHGKDILYGWVGITSMPRTSVLWVLVLIVFVIAPPAHAAALDCKNAETQAALDVCAGKELQDAEKELNRVYKLLDKEISDPVAKAALAEAEKTWEAYRDAECKFESGSVAGGSAEGMVVAYCQAQRARTRVTVLKRIMNCKEGDLTCPSIRR